MKKIMIGIFAITLLLTGCQQENRAPKTIISTSGAKSGSVIVASSSTPSAIPSSATNSTSASDYIASQPLSDEEGKLLQQFADDIANSAFRLTAQNPETQEAAYQKIATDGDLGAQIAKLLLENEVASTSNIPENARTLSLQAETGNLSELALFHGIASADDESGGQMVLQLDMDGVPASYVYDKSVFEQIDALYKSRIQGVKTEFTGNAVLIPSTFDLARLQAERGYEICEFIQFDTRVLWRFVPHTEGYFQPSTVELLDTVTGRSLYTNTIQENVLRMEKFNGEAGFDYRIITPTGILYRASGDRSREKSWRLPGNVSLFAANEELSGTFDMQYNQLAYADQEGISLADADGSNSQPILFHNVLPDIMRSAAAAGFTYYFNDPYFLGGGTKLVTSIISPQTGSRRLGFAVTDLDTMETSYFTGATATNAQSVRYLNDQVVAAQDDGILNLINVKNNDRGALPLNGLEGSKYLTYDCNVFAVWEPKVSGNSAYSSSTYLCPNTNMMDRSKRLLDTYGGKYTPLAMTEEYMVGLNEDSRGAWFAISRYRTVPRSGAASSSSPSVREVNSNNNYDETSGSSSSENAGLPPDITPDL